MPLIDRDALLAEDIIEQEEGLPFRFATNVDANINMSSSGKWTQLNNGDKLWQLEVYSEGARSLSFIYDNFNIPKGATYYIYNPLDTHKVTGGYTYKNNSTEVEPFSSGLLFGSRLVLEYYEPKGAEYSGDISISKATHGYKNVLKHIGDYTDKGYGDALPCENNINCPEWSDWQDVMKSVAMIVNDSGTRICTGALINNYNEDETYYFLTADHCTGTSTDTETWVMYFRYEQALCDSAYDGNMDNFVNGGTTKASGEIVYGDYLLLELTPVDDTIPSAYDIYYAGWSADTTAATSTVSIHHPLGDVKKISIDKTSPISNGPNISSFGDSHWKTKYFPADSGTGTIEGSSSGAPLFDQNQRIIGQHTTSPWDTLQCTTAEHIQRATFGKFEVGYDDDQTDSTTYLKYWLDPSNIGITTMDGLYPNAICCMGSIRGNIDYDSQDIIDISDLVYLVDFMFRQEPAPECESEGDFDGSGEIDITDLVSLVDFMFTNGPGPAVCP